jgi:hypothetical protein
MHICRQPPAPPLSRKKNTKWQPEKPRNVKEISCMSRYEYYLLRTADSAENAKV